MRIYLTEGGSGERLEVRGHCFNSATLTPILLGEESTVVLCQPFTREELSIISPAMPSQDRIQMREVLRGSYNPEISLYLNQYKTTAPEFILRGESFHYITREPRTPDFRVIEAPFSNSEWLVILQTVIPSLRQELARKWSCLQIAKTLIP